MVIHSLDLDSILISRSISYAFEFEFPMSRILNAEWDEKEGGNKYKFLCSVLEFSIKLLYFFPLYTIVHQAV